MSGKALKKLGIETVRLSKPDYEDACLVISNFLNEIRNTTYPQLDFKITKTYTDKKDFGDIDVIMSLDGIDDSVVSKITDSLADYLSCENLKFVLNKKGDGSIEHISIQYPVKGMDFQLDLIMCSKGKVDFKCNTMSNSEFSKILGLMLKQNTKVLYSDECFYYKSSFKDLIINTEIKLSFFEMIELLGYDVKEYKKGFKTENDIFRYLMKSDIFIGSKFINFETTLNNRDRRSNRVRPTVSKFLNFVIENQDLIKEDPDFDVCELIESRIFNKTGINSRTAFISLMDEYDKLQKIKEQINWHSISALFPDLHPAKCREILLEIMKIEDLYEIVVSNKDDSLSACLKMIGR